MRRLMLAVMMVAGLGGTVVAQEARRAMAVRLRVPLPAPVCAGVVSLAADAATPGLIVARYEEAPLFRPSTCVPYAGIVYWYVTSCSSHTDDNCDTYVVASGPRSDALEFTPLVPGQHIVTMIRGDMQAGPALRAYYRLSN